MPTKRHRAARMLMWAAVACAASFAASQTRAEALLVMEADSGKVLFAENAAYPWYPASVTKLMTAYVTLRAVKEGRLTLDKPLIVSANAAAQAPVKMGFPAGTVVTTQNGVIVVEPECVSVRRQVCSALTGPAKATFFPVPAFPAAAGVVDL